MNHNPVSRLTSILFAAGLFGCEPTTECVQLEQAVADAEEALAKVELRAVMRPKIEDQLAAAERKAKKILSAYGLDQPEEALTKVFEERAAAAKGVKLERTTKKTGSGPEMNPNLYDTVWRFTISPRPIEKVFDLMDQLAESPPVARLSLFSKQKDGSYVLELTRITIPEAPFMPEPAPLPDVPDISRIPAQWGFCGAGRLRARVKEIEQKIAELKADADATTVAMPTGATWDAKGIRAQQKGALERGGRAVLGRVLRIAEENRLPVTAIGVEDEAVLIEVSGRKDRVGPRFEAALPVAMREALKKLPSPVDDLQRYELPNPAWERMQPPGKGGEAGHDHGGLGLPSPEEMRLQYEEQLQRAADRAKAEQEAAEKAAQEP